MSEVVRYPSPAFSPFIHCSQVHLRQVCILIVGREVLVSPQDPHTNML